MAETFAGDGVFYVIQVDPDALPQRVKLGWSKQIAMRLTEHRRRWPNAVLVKTWPCAPEWEKPAIHHVRYGGKQIAAEVFDLRSLVTALAQLDAYLINKAPLPVARTFAPRPHNGFINHLPRLMHERRLSVGALSAATGLSQATLRRIVNDFTDRFDKKTLDVLCSHFGVQLNELFEWVPNAEAQKA